VLAEVAAPHEYAVGHGVLRPHVVGQGSRTECCAVLGSAVGHTVHRPPAGFQTEHCAASVQEMNGASDRGEYHGGDGDGDDGACDDAGQP
jgi:hypothetical protein